MKTAVLLTGISAATVLFSSSVSAQYTAAGATATISAANTVNQSQQAPARDPKVAARYGNAVADRQARARSSRAQVPQAVGVPQQTGRATQLARPATQVQQPAAPARDPKVAARYGNAVADRQARARQPARPTAAAVQQQAGVANAPVVQVRPVRAPDPGREQRIIDFQRQKAISGNPTSQYDLGMRYLKGKGVEQDRAMAVKWFNMAAKNGYSRAKKQLEQIAKQPAPPKAKAQ